MKPKLQLFCLLILLILFGCFLSSWHNRVVRFQTDENNMLLLSLKTDDSNELLYPWLDEETGIYYFFLPSFIQNTHIYCDKLKNGSLSIDQDILFRYGSFIWEAGVPYTIGCGEKEYEVVFMRSANLPALFLETDSGDMNYINENKSQRDTGGIKLVQSSGNIEYHGDLSRISARGNSTFSANKKSYTISLNASAPLCGLDSGKKWNLLALYFEYDKIHSKLVYEMADFLGLEYTPGCTWVDLYCNGEYQGLYLLTESINAGNGRVEINDGFLIEKDVEDRLDGSETYFTTDLYNYLFTIKEPKNISAGEVNEVKDFIQRIEDLLAAKNISYREYIDMDSFAKQFLIDKIALDPDAMKMSSFYYMDHSDNILRAGPVWDYDRAMGTDLPDYTLAIEDVPNGMDAWYMQLYADPAFYDNMLSYYKQLLPLLTDMLAYEIDEYVDLLTPAVTMDSLRWPIQTHDIGTVSYTEYDSYVRYLKYFLACRLNFLNELWHIPETAFPLPASTGQYHSVRFFTDNGCLLETRTIKDGECIPDLPAFDNENTAWQFEQTGKSYSSFIPIYEDIDFYPFTISTN